MKTLALIYTLLCITVFSGLLYVDHSMDQGVDAFKQTQLQAVNDERLQPFGLAAEDDETATQILQPADYSKQTTLHYSHIQGTSPRMQSDKVILQGGRESAL